MKEKSKRTKFLSEYSYIAVYVNRICDYQSRFDDEWIYEYIPAFCSHWNHWIRHGTDLFDRRYRPFCRFHACACKRFFGSDI